jgi:hypothetical protein
VRRLPLALAIACLVIAVLVFLLADGARAIYSGVFFVMLGVVALLSARRR